MINSEHSPIFIDSTLKITAAQDFDIVKELAYEDTQNKTIEELLKESEDVKKQ